MYATTCNLLNEFEYERSEGTFNIPMLTGVKNLTVPTDLIGFDKAIGFRKHDAGVHFYLDDSRFERFWKFPYRYIPILKRFSYVLTPDFSVYTDMPKAMQIWNVFRSRLLGQMMQREGITVIPSISWSDHTSFAFCFDGIPHNSIVSISSVGTIRNKESWQLFSDGVNAMCTTINPRAVIFYGKNPGIDFGDITVHYYKNSNFDWKK